MRKVWLTALLITGVFYLCTPEAKSEPSYWQWRRSPQWQRRYYAFGYASRPYKRRANYYQLYAYYIPGRGFFYPDDYVYNYRGWYASRPYKVRANYYKLIPYYAPWGKGFYYPDDYIYNLRSYPCWSPR